MTADEILDRMIAGTVTTPRHRAIAAMKVCARMKCIEQRQLCVEQYLSTKASAEKDNIDIEHLALINTPAPKFY